MSPPRARLGELWTVRLGTYPARLLAEVVKWGENHVALRLPTRHGKGQSEWFRIDRVEFIALEGEADTGVVEPTATMTPAEGSTPIRDHRMAAAGDLP